MRRLRVALAFALAFALPAFTPGEAQAAPPLDPAVEARVADLIGRMTLEEKVGQLVMVARSAGSQVPLRQEVRAGRVGSVLSVFEPDDQKALRDSARASRLGIPLLFAKDILHGVRSITPVPLGLASSFDLDLVERTGRLDGEEARRIGIDWALGPTVDIARDARWGRMVDGAGEETLLATSMGLARQRGMRAVGMIAGPKHFVGYGAVEAGRDYAAAEIATSTLHNVYLKPFKALVDDGADAVMAAFHSLNGRPMTADGHLLTDLLKRDWGFNGIVVSDWHAIEELLNHGIAATPAEAARVAFLAGVDVDMNSGFYANHLAAEVRAGRVPMARLDDAVARVLRVKYGRNVAAIADPGPKALVRLDPTPETRALAREAAQKSIVLIDNDRGILPFGPGIKRIALIGPQSAEPNEHIGPLVTLARWDDSVSTWTALAERAKALGIAVDHHPGCDLACADNLGFNEAVAKARDADVIVALLGEQREWTSEGQSRASLDLPGRQQELLDRLLDTDKPVVLVTFQGRPLALSSARGQVAAWLTAWFPGIEGGPALVDILFGDANPSAKMPVSTPRTTGQAPIYLGQLPSGRPYKPGNRYTSKWIDAEPTPLVPFGWGLSYTRFDYADLRVGPPDATGNVAATVRLSNSGPRAGTEVVQLYLRQMVASRSRPLDELVAFTRVALQPGESRDVSLVAPAAAFAYYDEDARPVREPGRFRLRMGGSSVAPLTAEFDIKPAR